jgi:hypothetical protein
MKRPVHKPDVLCISGKGPRGGSRGGTLLIVVGVLVLIAFLMFGPISLAGNAVHCPCEVKDNAPLSWQVADSLRVDTR